MSPSSHSRTEPDPRPVVVVVAEDGFSAAVRHGLVEAERRGCALHVVHVVDLDAPVDHVLDDAVRQAHAMGGDHVRLTSVQHHGDASEALVTASSQAQLVVVQRRVGRSVRPHPLAGLVSTSLAPVVCVPGGWEPAHRTGTVTVGVLDTLTCGPLLDIALEEAAYRGARLRVIHVEVEADQGPSAEELWATLGSPERRPFAGEVLVSVAAGRPGVVLVAASATSDLLVVGRHHALRPGGSQIGGVARRVLRDASCPVLLPTPSRSVSSAAWVFAGHLD